MTHLSPASAALMNQTVRAMPLSAARERDLIRVIAVRGGGREIEQLIAAGLTPGRVCTLAGHGPGGAIRLDLDGRQLAIGGNVAPDIWVRLIAV